MTDIFNVLNKEMKAFLKGGWSGIIIYLFLILVWGSVISTNFSEMDFGSGMLWWIFFSVVVSGNFSSTIFINERLTGSMEILLTSGMERRSILSGKVLFVVLMSLVAGFSCLFLSLFSAYIYTSEDMLLKGVIQVRYYMLLFTLASFMNASCGCFFSLRFSNPKLSQFTNLIVLAIILTIYTIITEVFQSPRWVMPLALFLTGSLFFLLAYRDFYSERVVQPFSM